MAVPDYKESSFLLPPLSVPITANEVEIYFGF